MNKNSASPLSSLKVASPIKKTSSGSTRKETITLLHLTPFVEDKICGICKQTKLGSKRTQKQGMCSKCFRKVESATSKCKFNGCGNQLGYGENETYYYCQCSKFLCSQHKKACGCKKQNGVTYSRFDSQEYAKKATKVVVDLTQPTLRCVKTRKEVEKGLCRYCQKKRLLGEWQKESEHLCKGCQKELKAKIPSESVKIGVKVGICCENCPYKLKNDSECLPLHETNCSKGHPITHVFEYYIPQNILDQDRKYRSYDWHVNQRE